MKKIAKKVAKIKVAFVGPCSRGPMFRIHAAGCSDIKRDERTHESDQAWVESITSKRDAAN